MRMRDAIYGNLAALMAKHGLLIDDIARILEKSYKQTHQKLHGKAPISLDEANKIKTYFKEHYAELVTIDYVFEKTAQAIQEKQLKAYKPNKRDFLIKVSEFEEWIERYPA